MTITREQADELPQQQLPTRSHGEYLATIMSCGGCHTGGALAGRADDPLKLAALWDRLQHTRPGGILSPNLTPKPETRLGVEPGRDHPRDASRNCWGQRLFRDIGGPPDLSPVVRRHSQEAYRASMSTLRTAQALPCAQNCASYLSI